MAMAFAGSSTREVAVRIRYKRRRQILTSVEQSKRDVCFVACKLTKISCLCFMGGYSELQSLQDQGEALQPSQRRPAKGIGEDALWAELAQELQSAQQKDDKSPQEGLAAGHEDEAMPEIDSVALNSQENGSCKGKSAGSS